MLETELQRSVRLVGILFLAGDLRQRVQDLVEVLAVLRVSAGDHAVVRSNAPVVAVNACHFLQALTFEHAHRLAVERLGKQRRLLIAVNVPSEGNHRIGIVLDNLQVVTFRLAFFRRRDGSCCGGDNSKQKGARLYFHKANTSRRRQLPDSSHPTAVIIHIAQLPIEAGHFMCRPVSPDVTIAASP